MRGRRSRLLRVSTRRAVVTLAIAETASWGILHYAFGILLRPIANDLDVSEVIVAGAYSTALLAGGLAAAPVGRALDRHGPRLVMTVGSAVAAGALMVLAGTRNVTTLYVIWGVLGLCQAAVLYEAAFTAITTWFDGEQQRLRALLVVTLVGGLASTIFGPLIARATTAFGWRATVLGMASLVMFVVTPIHASLPKTSTKREATTSTDDVRVVSIVFAVHAFVSAGIAVHLVAHLSEQGASMTDAATMAGALGVAQVGGRLMAAPLRTLRPAARGTLLFAMQALALVAIGSGPILAGIIVFGMGNGLMTIERATIVADRFGRERYGENSGRIARAGLIARAAAPFAVGWARVHGGPLPAFLGMAVLLGLAALIFRASFRQRPRLYENGADRAGIPGPSDRRAAVRCPPRPAGCRR
jgi:MFS family permease